MTLRIAFLVFDGVEPLDVVGPFEAFYSAWEDNEQLFEIGLDGATSAPVTAAGGLIMTPHWSFGDVPRLDLLLVPGGPSTRPLSTDRGVLDWIAARDRETMLTLSVCTGAQLLAAAGLLAGLQATTHWNTYGWLRRLEPTIEILEGARWADNGRIVCSSGVSAGIDMALHVIARVHGNAVAARAARAMEYEYWPPRT